MKYTRCHKVLPAVYKEPRLYTHVLFNLCLPKYLDSYKNWLLHEYARKSNESDSLVIVHPPYLLYFPILCISPYLCWKNYEILLNMKFLKIQFSDSCINIMSQFKYVSPKLIYFLMNIFILDSAQLINILEIFQ